MVKRKEKRWLSFLTSLGSFQQSEARRFRSQPLQTFLSCLASVHPGRKASSKPSCAFSGLRPEKSVSEKYQGQVRQFYLLWSKKLHFQGKSSSCRPPAWWCKGPELWETRHSGKNSVKMYYEWINSLILAFLLLINPLYWLNSRMNTQEVSCSSWKTWQFNEWPEHGQHFEERKEQCQSRIAYRSNND